MGMKIKNNLFMTYFYVMAYLNLAWRKLKQVLRIGRKDSKVVVISKDRETHALAVFVVVTLIIVALAAKSQMLEDEKKRFVKRLKNREDASPSYLANIFVLLIGSANGEHIIGDLEEEYQVSILPQYGRRLAWCWYWGQVLCVVGRYLWRDAKRLAGLEEIRKFSGK